MGIFVDLVGEFAKQFMGEMGKAGASALFNRADGEQEDVGSQDTEYHPLTEVEEVVDAFWNALKLVDHEAALSWCDPAWGDDPERNQSLDEALGAAPAESWSIREVLGPDGWVEGEWLEWVAVEMTVTFNLGDGSFSTLPLILWMTQGEHGLQVADISWQVEDETDPGMIVFACERCPEHFEVVAGQGRVWVKCPSCWTPQEIDT